MTIGDRSGLFAVYLALFVAGLFYDGLVTWLERRGYLHGFTALFVVGGVLITLAGVAVIDPVAALISLGAFAASGLPMVSGSIWRYVRNREQSLEELKDEARDGDPT